MAVTLSITQIVSDTLTQSRIYPARDSYWTHLGWACPEGVTEGSELHQRIVSYIQAVVADEAALTATQRPVSVDGSQARLEQAAARRADCKRKLLGALGGGAGTSALVQLVGIVTWSAARTFSAQPGG